MKNKKYIVIVVIVAVIVSVGLWVGLNYRPGSYPYAEVYKIDVNEPTLINAINNIKEENPQYYVPTQLELQDGREDSLDYWYHIYLYFPERNEILYCWTRPSYKGYTTLAFVGINEGLELGHWKMINKDFTGEENREYISLFEERILNKVREKLGLLK